ncbi:TonB-dependent receptor [Ulvibacter antarcticus]|uniref:Hemoglobin/transferrin/lactoferrin receptor protein n=1 Tax=Ulvibacter antarcticus TaxID=442714 RepID=A0A3L9Z406_9FLAO|nr:TonB-dependent receptor [Ulvibacter antarcticus]RMA66159.1 hemoglobin/transferrin/lactoferrin receptor protein [Ulvibacter antarcticus]
MRLLILLAVVFFLHLTAFAQQIQVVENESQTPIMGVAVFNESKSKSGITDFDGNVDITAFSDSEIIVFQHISHQSLSLKKSEIVSEKNIVHLQLSASNLDEVVLSVAKFGQNKRDIPQQVASVTSEDVLFNNPQTAADLLESTGKVYIQKSQMGGGSPNIRGFSTNRLLITVDGVRFNTAIFRSGNVQNVISIDPFSIERTEVILGPGSVVYGSDAVGGVMNFYTKKPKFSLVEGSSFSGNAVARYASASEEKTGHFDFNIGTKEWAFLTSVSYTDFGDLRMGKNGPDDYLRNEYVETINGEDVQVENDNPLIQVATGYHQINAMQKVRYMPSEKWDFNLGLFYSTTGDYPRYDRLIRKRGDNLRSAEWYYGPQEWLAGNLQAVNKAYNEGIYDESLITISYQRFKEGRNDRDFGETTLFETDEKVTGYSGAWDFEKDLNFGKLHYGVEYVYNKVNSEGKKTDITTGASEEDASRYPDGSTWQSLAAYSSLLYKLAENLSLQGGLRYNHILVDATFDNRFYDFPFSEANINTGALTGSLGLSWNPNKVLGWRMNFGTAFRAPNIDDVGKIFDSEPGSVVVPNPDLKPEYATTGEVGATLNFDNVLKFDAAVYVTHLKDALVRRDFEIEGETVIDYQGEPSNVQAIQNAARAEVYGFEVGMEVNFTKQLKLTSQYNITDGFEEDDNGDRNPVRSAAPQFGNSHLIFKAKKLKLDAFVEYNGQFDFEDLAPSQQSNDYLYAADENGNPYSPNWHTLNLAAQYNITAALQINATLENISDQRYRPYSSGIAAPGRNLIVAANYTF